MDHQQVLPSVKHESNQNSAQRGVGCHPNKTETPKTLLTNIGMEVISF